MLKIYLQVNGLKQTILKAAEEKEKKSNCREMLCLLQPFKIHFPSSEPPYILKKIWPFLIPSTVINSQQLNFEKKWTQVAISLVDVLMKTSTGVLINWYGPLRIFVTNCPGRLAAVKSGQMEASSERGSSKANRARGQNPFSGHSQAKRIGYISLTSRDLSEYNPRNSTASIFSELFRDPNEKPPPKPEPTWKYLRYFKIFQHPRAVGEALTPAA